MLCVVVWWQIVAQRQQELSTLCSELGATADAPAFDDPNRLPITANQLLAFLQDKGVLGQTVVHVPRSGQNSQVVHSVLTEEQFLEAWHDGRTFVRGCSGVHHTHGPDEQQGLSQQEFVEVLARCAQHKYADLKNMRLAQVCSPMAYAFVVLHVSVTHPHTACVHAMHMRALNGGARSEHDDCAAF